MKICWRIATTTGLMGVLAACGGATTGGDQDMMDPPMEQPFVLPAAFLPTVDADDIADLRGDIGSAFAQERTQTREILPSGTANYQGAAAMNFDMDRNGTTDAQVIGELAMSAELLFSGDAVRGTIDDLHVFDPATNTPTEALAGSLRMSGSLDDGTKELSGSLRGDLTGHFNTETLQTVGVLGSFDGTTGDVIGVRTSRFFPPPEYEAAVLSGTVDALLDLDNDGVFGEGSFEGSFGATDPSP